MNARKSLLWAAALSLLGLTVWLAAGWHRTAEANDFTEYWASGRLLLAGKNPYAAGPMLEIERSVGFNGPTSLMMRNPPWTLPFILPFALVAYQIAQPLWLGLSLILVLLSTYLLSRLYSAAGQPPWVAWLVTAAFVPVATVLAIGQIGPLILTGITGFLVCQRKSWDASAGAFALLIAIKPHLSFLFWPVLLVWTVQQRRWRILVGLAFALLIASLIPKAFDPAVFPQHLELWKSSGILRELVPTLGGLMRLVFGLHVYWLASAPAMAAVVWLCFHWRSHRRDWLWEDQMPLLIMVSVTTASFGWFFDQVVLLPAILQATAWVVASRTNTKIWAAAASVTVNVLTLALILSHRTTFWYVWTAPAWLLLYLWLRLRAGLRVVPKLE